MAHVNSGREIQTVLLSNLKDTRTFCIYIDASVSLLVAEGLWRSIKYVLLRVES